MRWFFYPTLDSHETRNEIDNENIFALRNHIPTTLPAVSFVAGTRHIVMPCHPTRFRTTQIYGYCVMKCYKLSSPAASSLMFQAPPQQRISVDTNNGLRALLLSVTPVPPYSSCHHPTHVTACNAKSGVVKIDPI